MQIAALLTCHNRRDGTLECLEAITKQSLPTHATITVYLVDDGCSDGTADAVKKRFPEVRVIAGDGNLYWCGGMRLAWSEAMRGDYDAYLWLNDDTRLFPDAISRLLTSHAEAVSIGRTGIIVGSTCDPDDGSTTYGGMQGDQVIEPTDTLQTCESMNGNVVLVPRAVFQAVGNLSPEFRHTSGDQDYGFRSRQAGFAIWVAPGLLGSCRRNPPPAWADPSVPIRQRWRMMHGPKGQPPLETYIFCKRHKRWRWPVFILKLYCRTVFPGPWNWLKGQGGGGAVEPAQKHYESEGQ
jgi:GT2 family glycosyltransferase